jgi:hypothetical protein
VLEYWSNGKALNTKESHSCFAFSNTPLLLCEVPAPLLLCEVAALRSTSVVASATTLLC